MDLSFFRRAERMLADRSDAQLDYRVLVATLGALQAATASARRADDPQPTSDHDPLVELLTAGPGWREAVPRQGGCFNRAFTGPAPTPRQSR